MAQEAHLRPTQIEMYTVDTKAAQPEGGEKVARLHCAHAYISKELVSKGIRAAAAVKRKKI